MSTWIRAEELTIAMPVSLLWWTVFPLATQSVAPLNRIPYFVDPLTGWPE